MKNDMDNFRNTEGRNIGQNVPRQAFHRLPPERQQEILDTAVRLYAANPYEEVTVRRICQELSINLNTFYRYFQTRDDLYFYTYSVLMTRARIPEEMKWPLLDYIEDEETMRARFTEQEYAFLCSWRKAPVEMVHRMSFSPELNEEAAIRRNIEREIAEGSMRADLDADLAAYLFSTMNYLVFHYAKERGLTSAEDLDRLKHYTAYTFLNYGMRGRKPGEE